MPGFTVAEPLRDHYAGFYAGESAWRRQGALDKAANVTALCADRPHPRVLEIGCGEGSLLARLSELGFGDELYGLEISRAGAAATRRRGIGSLVECRVYDGYAVPYPDGRFDLAILSHVLEHVEYPRKLLYEAARVAARVFVELPLEATLRMPRDFVFDRTGHINFYSAKTARRLVQSCGLEVIAERVSNPSRASYAHKGGVAGVLKHWVKSRALALAPSLATNLWTYHASLLCRKARA